MIALYAEREPWATHARAPAVCAPVLRVTAVGRVVDALASAGAGDASHATAENFGSGAGYCGKSLRSFGTQHGQDLDTYGMAISHLAYLEFAETHSTPVLVGRGPGALSVDPDRDDAAVLPRCSMWRCGSALVLFSDNRLRRSSNAGIRPPRRATTSGAPHFLCGGSQRGHRRGRELLRQGANF
ncbi:MAG: hypothetical protein JWN04_1453 [Myxococcaceae bacterium]|nr:hypothetical protein [Myxococcaceae bacterium]